MTISTSVWNQIKQVTNTKHKHVVVNCLLLLILSANNLLVTNSYLYKGAKSLYTSQHYVTPLIDLLSFVYKPAKPRGKSRRDKIQRRNTIMCPASLKVQETRFVSCKNKVTKL